MLTSSLLPNPATLQKSHKLLHRYKARQQESRYCTHTSSGHPQATRVTPEFSTPRNKLTYRTAAVMAEEAVLQQSEGSSSDNQGQDSQKNRAFVKKRREQREQFAIGQKVWLKLPGEDKRIVMVIADTQMVSDTNEMRYKLNDTDEQPYMYPGSTDGWVPDRLVTAH